MSEHNDNTQSFVALTKGTMVSHYRIDSKIGAGGMGEVYLAEDTTLKRQVALKFMPAHAASDIDMRERFTREARAVAALSHPNIVTIYEVGEFVGRPFFAMEHVPGETLGSLIKQGKLSIDESVRLTMQICEGLYKAHESGVVHRDIKPGNIIIDNDGRPRILDFGLALVSGEDKITKTGSTLGTVGYMSPEQITSGSVDHRSDLFSVGVILYEMLTGRRPFEGDNDAAVLNAITSSTPEPVARFKSGVTGELQQVVEKALAKDPAHRYQHADGMLSDLTRVRDEVSWSSSRSVAISPARPAKKVALWAAVSMVVVILAAAGIYQFFPDDQSSPPAMRQRQITHDGDIIDCDLSPDGTHIAYVRSTSENSMAVMIRDLSGVEPVTLFEDEQVGHLRWAPNSTDILVTAWNDSTKGVYLIPKLGGTPRYYPIHVWPDVYLAWSPDGSQFAVAYVTKKIIFIDRQSGEESFIRVEGPFDFIWGIEWSPSGDWLSFRAFSGGNFALYLVRFDGSGLTKVCERVSKFVRWSSDGTQLYFFRWRDGSGSLMKISINPSTGAMEGEPTELQTGFQNKGTLSLSGDGRRLIFLQELSWSNLWLAEAGEAIAEAGLRVKPLTRGTSHTVGPSISPDGQRVAFSDDAGGTGHIYVMPIEGGSKRQLTHNNYVNASPAWSPDGKSLACASWVEGERKVIVLKVAGGPPTVFENSSPVSGDVSWSPGRDILYRQVGNRNYRFLDPHSGTERPLLADDSLGWIFSAQYSPGGQALAVHWNRVAANLDGVWIIPIDGSSWFHVTEQTFEPIGWSGDGRWIYGHKDESATVFRIRAEGGPIDTVLTLPFERVGHIAMTAGADRFVCQVTEQVTDVWLVENFDPDVE